MKVAKLEGLNLDYWVFKAEHPESKLTRADWEAQSIPYSLSWQWGGPIIERERISLKQCEDRSSYAYFDHKDGSAAGEAPLIAAMRAFVTSKFGEEVEDAPQPAGD